MQDLAQTAGSSKRGKKEAPLFSARWTSSNAVLGGIKDMEALPDALFVIDVGHDTSPMHEARKLGIPVVAVVDTNYSPDGIDHVIPGNDDAMRAILLYAAAIADAVLEGRSPSRSGGRRGRIRRAGRGRQPAPQERRPPRAKPAAAVRQKDTATSPSPRAAAAVAAARRKTASRPSSTMTPVAETAAVRRRRPRSGQCVRPRRGAGADPPTRRGLPAAVTLVRGGI